MYWADVVAIFSVLLHQPKQAEIAYLLRCPLDFPCEDRQ